MKKYLNSGLILSLLIGSVACSSAEAKPENASQTQNVQAERHAEFSRDSSGRKSPGEAKTENQANTRQIAYENLMDFVNDHESHKVGEKYAITKISPAKLQKKVPADKDGDADYQDLFYLEEADDDGYIGNGLLISKEMLASLAANAKTKAATLRMQAILAESKGEPDWIYRMSFVTKIEGLDKNGKVLWTAESAQPEKINFRHKPL